MRAATETLTDFRKAYSAEYDLRQQVIADLEFALIPGMQWAGSDAKQWANKPKPENNKLFKNIMAINGRFQEAEFGARISSASDEATDDDAETLQKLWRNDFNGSDGADALNKAFEEASFGGFGAFKVVAKYEDEEDPQDEQQYLSFEMIGSAASSVFFNAGALRRDKTDATQGWHLQRVNREKTEEEYGVDFSSFPAGTITNGDFSWMCGDGGRDVYIAHYYELVSKTIVEYSVYDESGESLLITKDGRKYTGPDGERIEKEDVDLILEVNEYDEKRRKVKFVEYAIMSGDKYLTKPAKLPFKNIPLIPMYGYHHEINGIEFYCGEVCRQRDSQRFLNMGFGALMEILSEPQVAKPEYLPEQMARHGQQRAEQSVINRPFLLSDPVRDANGNITHVGPIGRYEPPEARSGLVTSLQFLSQNIQEQSANGQATLPSNSSASAIQQVNERTDDAFLPLMTSASSSIRVACRTWIPAAQQLYFTNPRKRRGMEEDGSYTQVETMVQSYDRQRDVYGATKNTARGRYDVSIKQGESYRTKKDAERSAAIEILQYADSGTPLGQMALLSAITNTTGEGMQDMRTLARIQQVQSLVQQALPLLMNGYPPEKLGIRSEEELAIMQITIQQVMQAQQQQNPQLQAMAMEGQARMLEGQAAMVDKQVDMFNAETKRFEAIQKAQKLGMDANKTMADIEGQQLDNMAKVQEMRKSTLRSAARGMSNEDLLRVIAS